MTYDPDFITPPGETLRELLAEKGWSIGRLMSENSGFRKEELINILSGKIGVSPETASMLEKALGTPKVFWIQRTEKWLKKNNPY